MAYSDFVSLFCRAIQVLNEIELCIFVSYFNISLEHNEWEAKSDQQKKPYTVGVGFYRRVDQD